MADTIESNIVLRTQLPTPQGNGLGSIFRTLTKLEKRLDAIASKEYKIKFLIDEEALNRLGLQLKKKVDKIADDAAKPSPAQPLPRNTGPTGVGRNRVGMRTGFQTNTRVGNESESTETIETIKTATNLKETILKVTRDETDQVTKISQIESNRNEKLKHAFNLNQLLTHTQKQSYEQVTRTIKEYQELGYEILKDSNYVGFLNGKFGNTITLAKAQTDAMGRVTAEVAKITAATGEAGISTEKLPAGKSSEAIRNKLPSFIEAERVAAEQERIRKEKEIQDAANSKARKTAYLETVAARLGRRTDTHVGQEKRNDANQVVERNFIQFSKDALGNIVATKHKINLLEAEHTSQILKGTDALKLFNSVQARQAKQAKVSNLPENQAKVSGFVSGILNEGFTEGPSSQAFNKQTGLMDEIRNFKKISGNVFTGYQVEIAKANVSTASFTRHVLEGAQASRAMGDSLGRAVTKVSLWATATGAVFYAIRGIQEATRNIVELSDATTLLARVSRNLASPGAEFSERVEAARAVTIEVLNLTAAIGGSSEEALKAAAIFGRAGQNQKQIIESVRVSLLAAKIAELEVVEAAELLSSAIYQFNGNAEMILPTLDSLNTLSNNYRVTTGDLLQAISRTGSVIAQQNGRLTELAATTAVTAQVTSRSGAEIGNAMKTIASQMDRVETKRVIFKKLGLTVYEIGGASKSYTQNLLDLSIAMDQVNQAERNQITTNIAGVRQRNVLLSQIDNVIEIMKAENLALIPSREDAKSGSAFTEFEQSSKTLAAAIERLKAQMLSASATVGGPLADSFKNVINLLSFMLKMVSSGNSFTKMTGYLTGQLAAVTALSGALLYLKTTYMTSNSAMIALLRTQVEAIKVAYAQAFANSTLATSFGRVSAGILAASRALLLSIAPYAAIAVAIMAVVWVLGSLAEASAIAAAASEIRLNALKRETDIERNRGQAVKNSTRSITSLTLEIERLNKAEETKQNLELKQKYGLAVQEIARSAGIELSEEDIANPEKAIAKFTEERQRSDKNTIALNTRSLQESNVDAVRLFLEREKSKGKIRRYDSIIEDAKAGNLRGRRTSRETIIGVTQQQKDRELKNLSEIEAKMEELRKKKEELSKESTALKQFKELSVDDIRKNAQATKNLGAVTKESELRKEMLSIRDSLSFDKEATIQQDLVSLYETERDIQRDISTLIKNQSSSAEDLLEPMREYEHVVHRIRDLEIERFNAQKAQRREAFSDIIKRQGDFREEASVLEDRKRRALSTGKFDPTQDQFQEMTARRNAIGERIAENNRMRGTLWARGDAGDPNAVSKTEALKLDTQNAINDLRKLEMDRALAILRTEAEIAVERKKSADEVMRALGGLSEEDKLRLVAQASYFADNPDAKISAEDQFGMSSEDNAILSRFFESKLENIDPKTIFGSMMSKAGLGITRDSMDKEASVHRERAGRTDEELMGDVMQNDNQLALDSGILGGVKAIIGALQFNKAEPGRAGGGQRFDKEGNAMEAVPIMVDGSLIDFQPMVTAFEAATRTMMQREVDEVEARINKIIERKFALKGGVNFLPADRGGGE